ncbi:Hok/Gef family protein, partial [Escherichia coli]
EMCIRDRLVTRKDLCEVHIRTGQTEVAVFT